MKRGASVIARLLTMRPPERDPRQTDRDALWRLSAAAGRLAGRGAARGHLGRLRRRRLRFRAIGNDRQQQEILSSAADMDRGLAAIDRDRPVARVVVQEGSATRELVLHVGELTAGAAGI